MDQTDFRSVMTHEFCALLTDRIGHNDDRAVTLHRADKCQTDSLIAAGGLHNDRIRTNQAVLFRLLDHIKGCSCLDGTADVESLHFDQETGTSRRRHPLQFDHGCISDSFQNVMINHVNISFLCRLIHRFTSAEIFKHLKRISLPANECKPMSVL